MKLKLSKPLITKTLLSGRRIKKRSHPKNPKRKMEA